MQYHGIGRRTTQPLGSQSVVRVVVVQRSDQPLFHAFALQAQHHHRIHARQHGVEIIPDNATCQGSILRQQRGRTTYADLPGAQRAQGMQVGSRHPRMFHVTDDQHLQPGKITALGLPQRQHVQQALGGVGAAAIAGVDQGGALARLLREGFSGTVLGMAHDESTHAHRFQVLQRIQRSLALARGRGRGIEVDHVCAQALRGDMEGTTRARGRLEKQRADGRAQQRVALLRAPQRRIADLPGAVQQAAQGLLGQAFQGQQVTQAAVGIELQGHIGFQESAFPSASGRRCPEGG